MIFFSASPWRALFFRTLLVVMLLVLGSVGCRSGRRPKVIPFGVMDAPRNGEVLRGTVQLAGWMLADSGIEQVIVFVDHNYAATATIGGSRPDVANAYPAFSTRTDAGWSASLDTSKFPAGAHEVVVQGRANNGATRDLSSIIVSVKP
jgi:hypothetical protein